jgi:tetratricopeptide (TPR) repeat protein
LRNALDEDDLEMASKIQEHADRVYKSLESMSSSFEEEVFKQFKRIKAELFITKMQLSILEDDVPMAKFYEERAEIVDEFNDGGEVIMETMRMIYNSSLILYHKGQHDDVIHFLRKAMKLSVDTGFEDMQSIRTAACSLLGRSCIEINTKESLDLADEAIQTIESINTVPSIETFKLGIQLNKKRESSMDMEDLIMRMIMTVPILSNFKQILGILNDYALGDPQSAIKCFEYTFTNRLEPETDQECLEMLLVAMVNAHAKDKITPVSIKIDSLRKFLDDAERILVKNISKKCSSSAVTLLWTSGKTECKNNNSTDAIGWFQAALHRVLQVNEIDKAKIERALQNCYIQLEEYDKALEVCKNMSMEAQNSLITQYNNFKIYTLQGDEDKMLTSLQNISKFDEKSVIPLLSLCALNCETNTRVAIESMMCVFQKVNQGLKSDISIPTTLKFVIELILKQEESLFQSQYKETLLTLFQEVHRFAEKNSMFTVEELKWFCASSFNISRDCLSNEDYASGDFFAQASSSLNSLIKDDISISESLLLKLWKFRAGLISIMCQSKTPNIEHDDRWSNVRTRSLNLRIMIDEMMIVSQGQVEYIKHFKKDWVQCLLHCIVFQYQSEIELGNQNAVEAIIQETSKFKNHELDSTFVNICWDSKQPTRLKSQVLYLIIERHLGELSTPSTTLSRWIRLLLKQENDTQIQRIISQLIMRLNSQLEDNRFPVHEIEWMSTKCWNRGIGLIFRSDRSAGTIWCNYAMRLARFVNERFEATLTKLWDELA